MTTVTATTSEHALASIDVSRVKPEELPQVLNVLSRGMRDNPLHVAAFGTDPVARQQRVHQLFGLAASRSGFLDHMLVARNADGAIIGVAGMSAPGGCLPKPSEQLRMLPRMFGLGFGNARRLVSWLGAWGKHDPKSPHWHFGPLAVDAHLQSQGIGSAMMCAFCDQMDVAGDEAYLETDKEINVGFYQKFGFEVVDQDDVLGTPSWYMIREPASR